MTTSFGSICLGSLIVAFLQAVRAMLRNARGGRGGMLSYLYIFILLSLHSTTYTKIKYISLV